MRVFLIILGVVVVAGGLWAYSFYIRIFGDWESFSWNQKLTVTVETPEGERSGSAVSHIEASFLKPGSQSISAASSEGRSYGEAVVVALPDEKYLFVLRAENADTLTQGAFYKRVLGADAERIGNVADYYRRMLRMSGLSGPIPRDAYPRFVTFEDLSDPASVKLVDPDDLAATFGPGYALKSVTLELTGESVEYGKVEQVLPWLKEYSEKHYHLNGKRSLLSNPFTDPLATTLSPGDFSFEGG